MKIAIECGVEIREQESGYRSPAIILRGVGIEQGYDWSSSGELPFHLWLQENFGLVPDRHGAWLSGVRITVETMEPQIKITGKHFNR